jgi:hypothetical protein
MSLELVNTLATFGTFLVIAATATAALVQLRHARGSNQIAALDELRAVFQSREFTEAYGVMQKQGIKLIEDPVFRYQWAHPAARTDQFGDNIKQMLLVGNYFEDFGALLVAGLLDWELSCRIYSSDVINAWDRLQPLVAVGRRDRGNAVWENFEYAAMLSKKWVEAHPDGAYPRGAPRLQIKDEFLEADRQYATSLAPA